MEKVGGECKVLHKKVLLVLYHDYINGGEVGVRVRVQ